MASRSVAGPFFGVRLGVRFPRGPPDIQSVGWRASPLGMQPCERAGKQMATARSRSLPSPGSNPRIKLRATGHQSGAIAAQRNPLSRGERVHAAHGRVDVVRYSLGAPHPALISARSLALCNDLSGALGNLLHHVRGQGESYVAPRAHNEHPLDVLPASSDQLVRKGSRVDRSGRVWAGWAGSPINSSYARAIGLIVKTRPNPPNLPRPTITRPPQWVVA